MNNLKKLGMLVLAGSLTLAACKREYVYTNDDTNNNNNTDLVGVYNRTVNYTVVVTSQRESGFRGAQGVQGATVAVSVDGEIKTATTDANGLAVFTNLKPGTGAVSVSASNHTTAHFIVDLTASQSGGSNNQVIDNHSTRSAATMVTLLPVAGLGTATLRGKLEVERDFTNSDSETVPAGLGASLVARADFTDNAGAGAGNGIGYAHSGDGQILDFYYEGVLGTTTQNIDGANYSITLPATAYGIDVEVVANPYQGTLIISSSNSETRVFSANGFSTTPVSVWSGTAQTGEVYFSDIFYDAI